jgi:2-polyprenyl-6-hydroxyphenyl methylase/3-demethylubiquinone-9 3-methyltransferase
LKRNKPYYFKIKDPKEFLKHYLSIYGRDYHKERSQAVISLFPELKDKRVLDIGCGGGFYSLAACRKGARDVTFLDASPVCVKAAKINLGRENINSNGAIADATALPFRNGTFDFVICVDVIEHIPEDRKLLQEIQRILKSNGSLVLSTQNQNSLNYILEAPLQRYVLKNRKWMGWDPTHVRFYNPRVLFQLLKNFDFSIVKVSGTYFIPYMIALYLGRINMKFSQLFYLISYYLNQKLERRRLSSALLNLFGWGIICLCLKRRTC